MTPTARSLALLRRSGYLPAVVERWLPRLNVRADLWHFGDLLAVHAGRGEFLIVQVTTAAHAAARLAKAQARPELALWLAAGGRFEVHGWAKRLGRWQARRVEVRSADLAPSVLAELPRNRRRPRRAQGELF